MHCVICGQRLHTTNQAGIVCLECKLALAGKRNERGQAIRVRYCADCGGPYHPIDSSIRHLACRATRTDEFGDVLWMEKWTHEHSIKWRSNQ